MQVFHCDHCQNLVFFENTTCNRCGHTLAFLPDQMTVAALSDEGDGVWTIESDSDSARYRLCGNYTQNNICNWAVLEDSQQLLCRACRLTSKLHPISSDQDRQTWYRIEVAKRRLLYSLMILDCPLETRQDDPEQGLAFEYGVDDPSDGGKPFLTGHANGLISLNVAEADDVERKRRQLEMGEPYRTLLGHFRHEVGHFYWDRLIRESKWLDPFRDLFGDERADYQAALKQHYQQPAADWRQSFVSQYAAAHPWEDWAESWAHYLHMVDTLETAIDCGLTLTPSRVGEPTLKPHDRLPHETANFQQLIDRWFPLTYVLNNLNRGLGLQDSYPFVLPTPVVEKLSFIHDVIQDAARAGQPTELPRSNFWSRFFSVD